MATKKDKTGGTGSANRPTKVDGLRCSFCNKSQRDVQKLIAGPTVYICDECVAICMDILVEERDVPPPHMERPVEKKIPLASVIPMVNCRLCQLDVPLMGSSWLPKRGWICKPCADEITEIQRTTTWQKTKKQP